MYIGVDIGGTKCAVTRAKYGTDGKVEILEKKSFPTTSFKETAERIFEAVESFMPCDAIGICSGGPLDEKNGIILSPPNLPDWRDVHIKDMMRERFGVPVGLLNDANACAVAEWLFGAGRGVNNMIFLTFGTGLGAGLILDGRLYSGTSGNAGEVGHIRLSPDGPVGFGKAGSFEGFCSGGGIARLAEIERQSARAEGREILVGATDTKALAALAEAGDSDAVKLFEKSARMLGFGLSVLIDVLNPELIVIGSVFARSEGLFLEKMTEVIEKEALPESASAVRIVPAALGDAIGDYAAIAVAEMTLKGEKR